MYDARRLQRVSTILRLSGRYWDIVSRMACVSMSCSSKVAFPDPICFARIGHFPGQWPENSFTNDENDTQLLTLNEIDRREQEITWNRSNKILGKGTLQ